MIRTDKGLHQLPVVIAVAALLTTACNRVPSHVIKPDDMAEIMADVRMADAVVTVQNTEYIPQEKKLALKQAIFQRHGITEEQFDTSLVWYGHNVERFQDVNDKVIEILEKRLKEATVIAAGEAAMTVAGDSVDLWNGYPTYTFTKRLPSQYLTFSFEADQNWEKGDIYTLRTRVMMPGTYAQWAMTTEYEDGAIEMITNIISQSQPNKQELTLYTDSTRVAKRISGWMKIIPSGNKPAIIDSISLTRRRIDQSNGGRRSYQQRLIEPKKKEEQKIETETTDSAAVSE